MVATERPRLVVYSQTAMGHKDRSKKSRQTVEPWVLGKHNAPGWLES